MIEAELVCLPSVLSVRQRRSYFGGGNKTPGISKATAGFLGIDTFPQLLGCTMTAIGIEPGRIGKMADQLAGIVAAAVIQYYHVDVFYFHRYGVGKNDQLQQWHYGHDKPAARIFPDSLEFFDD